MKKLLYIIFFCFVQVSISQTEKDFQRKHVIFPGCETSDDKEECFKNNVYDFVVNNLKKEDLDYILEHKVKDTIIISASLYFDRNGKINAKNSTIGFGYEKLYKKFNYLVEDFPQIKPQLDREGRGVNTLKSQLMGFTFDDNRLKAIYDYETDSFAFSIVENVPVFAGCDDTQLNNEELRKCMSDAINKHVMTHFNTKKAARGTPKGIVRIYVAFKVSKTGEIEGIKVRAPNKKLEKETLRVIKLIPKLKKPGYHKGKPVIVPYSLPIVFKVA